MPCRLESLDYPGCWLQEKRVLRRQHLLGRRRPGGVGWRRTGRVRRERGEEEEQEGDRIRKWGKTRFLLM